MRRMRVNNVDGALKQIMVLKDPTTAANNTGGVIAAHHEGKIFICVRGVFSLEIGSLRYLVSSPSCIIFCTWRCHVQPW
jgi:hypothetical protein